MCMQKKGLSGANVVSKNHGLSFSHYAVITCSVNTVRNTELTVSGSPPVSRGLKLMIDVRYNYTMTKLNP